MREIVSDREDVALTRSRWAGRRRAAGFLRMALRNFSNVAGVSVSSAASSS